MEKTQEKKKDARKVISPTFRVSFPHVFKAHSGFEGQEPKFSTVMLFDKKTDLAPMKAAVKAAIVEKWGDKVPKNLRLPFRDGDEKDDLQGYAGNTFVTATTNQKPQIIDKDKEEILIQSDFYAGCFARASLVAFAYDKAGNKGVSFSLQNIQKIKDGDAFSGRKNAIDEFDSVDDGSDDEANYGDDDDLGLD